MFIDTIYEIDNAIINNMEMFSEKIQAELTFLLINDKYKDIKTLFEKEYALESNTKTLNFYVSIIFKIKKIEDFFLFKVDMKTMNWN